MFLFYDSLEGVGQHFLKGESWCVGTGTCYNVLTTIDGQFYLAVLKVRILFLWFQTNN